MDILIPNKIDSRQDIDTDGRFHLTCQEDGTFGTTPDWPVCKPACLTSDFAFPYGSKLTPTPEMSGKTHFAEGAVFGYKCNSEDLVLKIPGTNDLQVFILIKLVFFLYFEMWGNVNLY